MPKTVNRDKLIGSFPYPRSTSVSRINTLGTALISSLALICFTSQNTLAEQVKTSTNSYIKCRITQETHEWNCQAYDSDSHQAIKLDHPINPYDWVKKEHLSPAEQANIAPGCQGAFIDPLSHVDKDLDPNNFPLLGSAETGVFEEERSFLLEGNVLVTQGPRSIHTGRMSFNKDSYEASLEEGVTLRQPNVLIRGEEARVNGSNNTARFEDALFVIHGLHLHGSAGLIEQKSDNTIVLSDGRFTSCEPESQNGWELEGKEIRIERDSNTGIGKNVKLKLGPMPIAYIPYIEFPVGEERKSGILFPSISTSDGIDFSLPYYWNMAPNYDSTWAPRYISGRGAMLDMEFRHLHKYFETDINLAALPNDKGGNNDDLDRLIDQGQITAEEARPYLGDDRWIAHISQLGGNATQSRWYSKIDYTKTSDRDYLRDIGTSTFNPVNDTHLKQLLSVGYLFENWHISALAQDYQMLLDLDSPYQRRPQLNAVGNYNFGDFQVSLDHEYTAFDHDNLRWRNDDIIITGQRLATDYRLRWEQRKPWGFIAPELGHKQSLYKLDDDPAITSNELNPSISATQLSLDSGLIFEHPGGRFLQTFEPSRLLLVSRGKRS